jgi:pimeloyl-ACP methyl ester carboxylesterase
MSALVIDGDLVHYEVLGRGKPVLFIHGWLGSWRYWLPTMEALSDRHRTYALDLWGFGDSDKSKPRYQISNYVELVDSFLNYLGISQISIVGHALGASIALEYAASRPERVPKVMAISLPLSADTISRKLLDIAQNTVIAKILWWPQFTYKEVQKEAEKTGPGVITQTVQSASQLEFSQHFQNLGSSLVLLVYGEKDDLIDPSPAKNLNGHYPNIRRLGLAQAKHFPMLDEAAKFQRLLKDFLELNTNLADLELTEEWRRRTR